LRNEDVPRIKRTKNHLSNILPKETLGIDVINEAPRNGSRSWT